MVCMCQVFILLQHHLHFILAFCHQFYGTHFYELPCNNNKVDDNNDGNKVDDDNDSNKVDDNDIR